MNFFVQELSQSLDNILEKELYLLYSTKGAITISDIQTMSLYEREFFYRRVVELKAQEREAESKARAEADAAANKAKSSSKRRR